MRRLTIFLPPAVSVSSPGARSASTCSNVSKKNWRRLLRPATTADALLPKLVSLLGCGNDELKEILSTLGWRIVEVADAGAGVRTVWRRAPVRTRQREPRREKPVERKAKPAERTKPTAASLADLAARFSKK